MNIGFPSLITVDQPFRIALNRLALFFPKGLNLRTGGQSAEISALPSRAVAHSAATEAYSPRRQRGCGYRRHFSRLQCGRGRLARRRAGRLTGRRAANRQGSDQRDDRRGGRSGHFSWIHAHIPRRSAGKAAAFPLIRQGLMPQEGEIGAEVRALYLLMIQAARNRALAAAAGARLRAAAPIRARPPPA